MTWKFWQRPKVEKKKELPKISCVPLRFGMDLEHWRSRPDLVMEAQALYRTQWFADFYSVLVAERPKGYSEKSDLQLGRMNGFEECLKLIQIMSELPPATLPELQSTFGSKDDDD